MNRETFSLQIYKYSVCIYISQASNQEAKGKQPPPCITMGMMFSGWWFSGFFFRILFQVSFHTTKCGKAHGGEILMQLYFDKEVKKRTWEGKKGRFFSPQSYQELWRLIIHNYRIWCTLSDATGVTIRDHVENVKQGVWGDNENVYASILLGEVRASCGMCIINQVLLSGE